MVGVVRYLLSFLFCVFYVFSANGQIVNQQFKIIESKTLEPLSDGFIFTKERYNFCNEFGFLSLSLSDTIIAISCGASGHQTKDTTITKSGKVILISLNKSKQLDEVKAVGTVRPLTIGTGNINIPIALLNKIPAMAGERDILKALQFTPGVQFAAEGTSNLIVRGGGVDQNLVLLDDMPIYNLNHLFGFLSVIPTEAVKSAKLYKSSFPSEFGGRLSSVLDLRTVEGSLNKKRSGIAIGLLSSSVYVDQPIIKDKWSFFATGRTTVLDKGLVLYHQVKNTNSNTTKFGYGFYDVVAKTKFIVNPNNQLSLSFYGGTDKLFNAVQVVSKSDTENVKSVAASSLKWSNLSYSLRWIAHWKFGALNTGISSSNYDYERSNSEVRIDYVDPASINNFSSNFSFTSSIRSSRLYSNFFSKSFKKTKLNLGILAENKTFAPGINRTIINSIKDSTNKQSTWNSAILAGNVSLVHSGLKWHYDLGIRFEKYNCFDYMKSSLQPRLNLNYKLSTNNILKVAYSRMVQDVHLLTNTGIGINYDIWVPAIGSTPIAVSDQFVLANQVK
jgi:hypothetical protein